MKSYNAAISALLTLACLSSALAYDRVQYQTSCRSRDMVDCDTIGVLTALTEPSYGQPFDLEVAYVVEADSPEGMRLYLQGGDICSYYIDREDNAWPGPCRKGDTLRCTFTLTPLTIGTKMIVFRVDRGRRRWTNLRWILTLDYSGRPIDNPASDGVYEYFGLLPDAMRDTLYFVSGGCYRFVNSATGGLDVLAKMYPPLRSNTISTIDIQITPSRPFANGVYYTITYPDFLDVSLVDSSDWSLPVPEGDQLNMQLTVQPVKPGVGGIRLLIRGLRPTTIQTEKGLERVLPAADLQFDIAVAVDDNLNVIASATQAFPTALNSGLLAVPETAKRMNSLSAIGALSGESSFTKTVIHSEHWKQREYELIKSIYEQHDNNTQP